MDLQPTLSLTGHPGDHHRQHKFSPVEVRATPGLRAGVDPKHRGQSPGRGWGHLGRSLQAVQQWHVRVFLAPYPYLETIGVLGPSAQPHLANAYWGNPSPFFVFYLGKLGLKNERFFFYPLL